MIRSAWQIRRASLRKPLVEWQIDFGFATLLLDRWPNRHTLIISQP